MRPRGWHWFWTILAAVAGVVGAAAAVYPLLNTDQQLAYLVPERDLDTYVRVETLFDPIILTGNWYIRRGRWWWSETLRTDAVTTTAGYQFRGEIHMKANDRRRLRIHGSVLAGWSGKSLKWTCARDESDFELGVEIRSKTGLSWLRTALPLCLQT